MKPRNGNIRMFDTINGSNISINSNIDLFLEDFITRYFKRYVNVKEIESISAAEIYRKYNLVSGNSFSVKCMLYKTLINAKVNDPLIIYGPIGSGKDIIPKIIHDNSYRKNRPYKVFDCTTAGGLDQNIIITRLFGSKKGIVQEVGDNEGILKEANGGTLFLDEVHHLPLEVQAMLFRVIQNKEIRPLGGKTEHLDVRIIAGTSQDISELVRKKEFYPDLLSRLCWDVIVVPTLQERGKEEIIILAQHILNNYCEINRLGRKILSSRAQLKLATHDYKTANIRELEAVVANAAKYSTSGIINEEEISFTYQDFRSPEQITYRRNDVTSYNHSLEKSKEWLWCIIQSIEQLKDSRTASSRDIIPVFKSPHGNSYSKESSFSEAIKIHLDNFIILVDTSEFSVYKGLLLKWNVLRREYHKSLKTLNFR